MDNLCVQLSTFFVSSLAIYFKSNLGTCITSQFVRSDFGVTKMFANKGGHKKKNSKNTCFENV